MVKKRNLFLFVIVFVAVIVIVYLLLSKGIIDINKVKQQGSDFHYSIISLAAVIGGFLFTGIGILISALSNERVKRLWDNNYLDNLYRTAFAGILGNVIAIIFAIIILSAPIVNDQTIEKMIIIELEAILVGIFYFLWCIYYLRFIITRLKESN